MRCLSLIAAILFCTGAGLIVIGMLMLMSQSVNTFWAAISLFSTAAVCILAALIFCLCDCRRRTKTVETTSEIV